MPFEDGCGRHRRVEPAVFYSAQKHGILPITSVCNVRCVFCSHRQNPPGVETFAFPHRPQEEVKRSLDWLGRPEKVVIGESVTRIIEGEPFTHPRIMDILAMVRRRLPDTLIEITTNGSLLDQNLIRSLKDLAPVEVNLSLNSSSPLGRQELMRDSAPEKALEAAADLGRSGIVFHGSIVAMPMITGWDDLRRTILFLDGSGARTIRVFLPGYTQLAPPELRFDPAMWDELLSFVEDVVPAVSAPVTLEPPKLGDLDAVVEGVIPGSPAHRAGLSRGDVITAVNGRAPFSRVDAFRAVRSTANPDVMFLRGRDPHLTLPQGREPSRATLRKGAGESSGLVLSFDVDPDEVREADRLIRRRRARRPMVLTSKLARAVVDLALRRALPDGPTGMNPEVAPAPGQSTADALEVAVHEVPNRFFGGSIMAAGLLVVEDFLAEAREVFSSEAFCPDSRPDLVLIPSRPFDERGRDLVGRSYLDLEEEWGIAVELV